MSLEINKLAKSQTNCTVKNEKGDICAGYLKEYMTAPESLLKQLPPNNKLYRCKRCLAIYASPPQGHLRAGQDDRILSPQTDEEPELIK